MRSQIATRMRVTALAIFSVLAIVACTTVVEETGRKQFNVLSPAKEASMGLSEFEKYKQSKPVVRGGSYNAMAQRVGARLQKVITVPNAQWEFVVFQDSTPNAFALPGGKVGIHSGLFNVVQNEAQLAAVLGHEIGHVKARHSGERLTNATAGAVVGAIAGEVLARKTGLQRGQAQAVTQGAVALRTLRFSRNQELEADKLGALYMARAGYDPRESINLWKNFGKAAGGNSTPEFLRTHPLDTTRIAALEAYMPTALAAYKN